MNKTTDSTVLVAIAKLALDFLKRDTDIDSVAYRLLERVEEGFAALEAPSFTPAQAMGTLADPHPAPEPNWQALPIDRDELVRLAALVKPQLASAFYETDTADQNAAVVVKHGIADEVGYLCSICKAKLIIAAVIKTGNIIHAIKILRDFTGASLKAAKDAVYTLR